MHPPSPSALIQSVHRLSQVVGPAVVGPSCGAKVAGETRSELGGMPRVTGQSISASRRDKTIVAFATLDRDGEIRVAVHTVRRS